MAVDRDRPPATSPEPGPRDGEGFLERWSRRKGRLRQGTPEPEGPPTESVPTATRPGPGGRTAPLAGAAPRGEPGTGVDTDPRGEARTATGSAPAELTDADMPPLDSLDESSDWSGFLSRKVSAELRRAALRKLFSSAMFNVRDGLDDYDEDFRSFAPLGDVVTADMRGIRERRAQAERARAEHASVHEEGGAREHARDGVSAEAPGEVEGREEGRVERLTDGQTDGRVEGPSGDDVPGERVADDEREVAADAAVAATDTETACAGRVARVGAPSRAAPGTEAAPPAAEAPVGPEDGEAREALRDDEAPRTDT